MFKEWLRFASWVTVLLLAGGLGALGQEEKASPIGDITYLKYTYTIAVGAEGLSETTTTEIVLRPDGQYEIVTTTRSISSPGEVHLGFAGVSLQWLGLYVGGTTTGRFDISQLNAFSDVALEPHHTYTLPDGGLLQMGDAVTIAGLSGVKGVFTNRSVAGATITVVMATDLQVRRAQDEELQVLQDVGVGFDARPHQDAVLVRMPNHGLADRVARLVGDVDDLEPEGRPVDALDA